MAHSTASPATTGSVTMAFATERSAWGVAALVASSALSVGSGSLVSALTVTALSTATSVVGSTSALPVMTAVSPLASVVMVHPVASQLVPG